jgi:hypothetical protein
MKVIGITKTDGTYPSDAYVAIVSHEELCVVANKARYSDREHMPLLKVGDVFDLREGYHYRNEIVAATKAMTEAYTKFAKVAPIAAQFAGVVITKDGASA